MQQFLIRTRQRKLKLRATHPVLNRQLLHRLQIQRDAGDRECLRAQALNDLERGIGTLGMRLEIDEHPTAVERGVGAVDANERREARYRRILENFGRERLLALSHRGKRDRLRGLRNGLNRGIILHREKSFGHDQIEHHRECECADRHEQGRALPQQHPVEPNRVARNHPIEEATLSVLAWDVGRQHAGTHHRRQRERDQEGN